MELSRLVSSGSLISIGENTGNLIELLKLLRPVHSNAPEFKTTYVHLAFRTDSNPCIAASSRRAEPNQRRDMGVLQIRVPVYGCRTILGT